MPLLSMILVLESFKCSTWFIYQRLPWIKIGDQYSSFIIEIEQEALHLHYSSKMLFLDTYKGLTVFSKFDRYIKLVDSLTIVKFFCAESCQILKRLTIHLWLTLKIGFYITFKCSKWL